MKATGTVSYVRVRSFWRCGLNLQGLITMPRSFSTREPSQNLQRLCLKRPPASTLFLLSEVEFMLGHYDAAIDWGLQAAAANPHVAARDPFLAMAYALKGDRAREASAVAGVLKASPQFSIHENFLFSNGDPEHPAFAEYRRKV